MIQILPVGGLISGTDCALGGGAFCSARDPGVRAACSGLVGFVCLFVSGCLVMVSSQAHLVC